MSLARTRNETGGNSFNPAAAQATATDRASAALLVLCGLPASGKTSIAHSLLRNSAEIHVHSLHVCFDSIITASMQAQAQDQSSSAASFSARATSSANSKDQHNDHWQASRASALSLIRSSLHLAAGSGVGCHTLVIADDNMQFRSMRHECYQLAAAEGAAYLQLYLPCTAEDAVKKNADRWAAQILPEGQATVVPMAAIASTTGKNGLIAKPARLSAIYFTGLKSE